MQTYVNIFQIKLLYIFSYLVNVIVSICFYLIFMQTYVNIFQIKLLYIFSYLVNVIVSILNNGSVWI